MIDFFRLRVLGAFSGAQAYLAEMAAAVPSVREKALHRVKEQAERERWEYDDYDCAAQEVEALFEYHFRRILARSFVIYLHSLVEHSLGEIARDLRARQKLSLKHNEVTGSSVERVRIYLEKVAGVNVSVLRDWSFLRDLAKIRDVLVHRGGELGIDRKERRKLQELACRLHGLVSASASWDSSNSQLKFDDRFCKFAVDKAYAFFEQLLNVTRSKDQSV